MKNLQLSFVLGCIGALLWGSVACRPEPVEIAAVVTMTQTSSTPTTVYSPTANPTNERSTTTPTIEPPTPTATAIPSTTPFFFDEVTHQIAVSDGGTLAWISLGTHQVLQEPQLGYPDFSPDGRYIAYVTHANSFPSYIIISDVMDDAPFLELVFAPAQFVIAPDWSPDSQQLVFAADLKSSGQNPDLYTISLDDPHTAQLLFESDTLDLEPVWSPNGREIAFASAPSGRNSDSYNIYLINADGTDLRPVTMLDGDEREPAWSPDGEYLAFIYSAPDQPEDMLAILPRTQFGYPEQQPLLLDFPTSVSSPIWSEDGQLISFVAEQRLYVTDLAGVSQFVLSSSKVWHMDWRFTREGASLKIDR